MDRDATLDRIIREAFSAGVVFTHRLKEDEKRSHKDMKKKF